MVKDIKLQLSWSIEGNDELNQNILFASMLSTRCVYNISGTNKDKKMKLSGRFEGDVKTDQEILSAPRMSQQGVFTISKTTKGSRNE